MNKVEKFLKELRESADIQYKIFTQGSCFRLYLILKILYPNAIAYWSDRDNHCLISIDDTYYDIGGKINKDYVESLSYYRIPERQLDGYKLLKYGEDTPPITVEKYKKDENNK